MIPRQNIQAVCFDWGGTLMFEQGVPAAAPMGLWPQVKVIKGATQALAA